MDADIPQVEISDSATAIVGGGDHFFVPAVSAAMRAVERTVDDIAGTDIPVLLIGESGTGKRAMALRIYQLSQGKNGPLVKINCATLAPDFFGGREGGTNNQHLAKTWPANGTLFLDEIGELSPACQPKLLYALPETMMSGDGSSRVRIIASTRRDLELEMRQGRFREDLYYRICGVCLRLLPLRQRKEDIPALTEYFLVKYAALLGHRKPEISAPTLRGLVDYPWPGNIRELEYAIQKIVALGDERAALVDLEKSNCDPPAPDQEFISLKQAARAASRQAEKELILKVLSRTRWNRKRAAKELQISYKALLYKMKQGGLDSAGS